jgi:hypothetical protein
MKYSKIDTELAYALLMSSFDTINKQRKEPCERKGVIQYTTEQIRMCSSSISVVTPKFGLTTPPINLCIDLSEDKSGDDDGEITAVLLIEILDKVKTLSQIVEGIKKQGINRAIFNERYLPFMNSATSLFLHRESHNSVDNFESHSNRLAAVVQGWGFEIVRSEGDGNCFFSSAAVSLLQTEEKESLLNIGQSRSVDHYYSSETSRNGG